MGLNEECFTVILRKLPPKMKDPGKFTIPCLMEGSYFDKCLCDLGVLDFWQTYQLSLQVTHL